MNILANFMLLAVVTVPAKPLHMTYEEKFDHQVDAVTLALIDYARADCTSPEFHSKAEAFKKELTSFADLAKNIPDDEPDLLQYKQLEIGSGVASIADKIITIQNQCVDSNYSSDGSLKSGK